LMRGAAEGKKLEKNFKKTKIFKKRRSFPTILGGGVAIKKFSISATVFELNVVRRTEIWCIIVKMRELKKIIIHSRRFGRMKSIGSISD